jgi:hypothetical protein
LDQSVGSREDGGLRIIPLGCRAQGANACSIFMWDRVRRPG